MRIRRPWWWVGSGAVLILAVTPHSTHRVELIYNPSVSAPRGWYALSKTTRFEVDDYALVTLPVPARRLADVRHYLPQTVPLLKQIAAVNPQFVCVRAGSMWVDGILVATALSRDGKGRPLDAWRGCRLLAANELLLVGRENPVSFDSRYFGPVRRDSVIGKAVPVWTW